MGLNKRHNFRVSQNLSFSVGSSLVFWTCRQIHILLHCFIIFIWLLKLLYWFQTQGRIQSYNSPYSWRYHSGPRNRVSVLCWLLEECWSYRIDMKNMKRKKKRYDWWDFSNMRKMEEFQVKWPTFICMGGYYWEWNYFLYTRIHEMWDNYTLLI